MNSESLDDLIHDYLSGVMDIETRKDFESQLASHPEMAERVRFERELYHAIGSSTENDLRANMQQIARRLEQTDAVNPANTERKPNKSRIWLLFSVIILSIALLWWSVQHRIKPENVPVPASEPVQSISAPPSESVPPAQESTTPKAVQKSRPVASAYDPVPALETYVGSQFRSQEWKISVQKPAMNARLGAKGGKTTFHLAGNLQGGSIAESRLRLLIFNNNLQDFEAMKPLTSEPLKIAPDGNFFLDKTLFFKAGLYYYLIEDEESGNWLFVGKFRM